MFDKDRHIEHIHSMLREDDDDDDFFCGNFIYILSVCDDCISSFFFLSTVFEIMKYVYRTRYFKNTPTKYRHRY